MIKKIVKRDGHIEDFSPNKVNKWGEWASRTLGSFVDWSHIVTHTVSTLPEVVDSQQLQERLIQTCLDQETWSYYRMAGRLYAAYLNKRIHGDKIPTVLEVQTELLNAGLMRQLNYSPEEYAFIETFIDHKRDFKSVHFELHQVRKKYSLRNKLTEQEYETQQFVYMRMAMALAEDEPVEYRLQEVKNFYDEFSEKRINAPTPNYVNLGTPLFGLASCCLYTTHDTAPSLAIGDHIAYTMTYMSAGIGSHIKTRALGEAVRGGLIEHQGRLPYYRALDGAIHANLQNGRGGAATTYYEIFNKQSKTIAQLKNPMSTTENQIKGLDYAMSSNKFFAKKAAKKEDIFAFDCHNAPDLYQAFYSEDLTAFESLYSAYEQDDTFPKHWMSARDLVITAMNESYEAGQHYLFWADEVNRHTPFKDVIYSSNLCTEIMLPTDGYGDMMDLYSTEDHGRGEVAICTIGGVVVSNIHSDEQYAKTAYYALKMVDKCIHQAEYKLPHVGVTSKARLNAGIGIMGLAHHMAKKGLAYSSEAGKQELHRVAERHAYFLIEASLKLGQELGNAPWMHKTKWPEGWLPIDTYNRNVDSITDFSLERDWEDLRQRIVANKGIRNSVVISHMPGESSSKGSGTSNSLYPVRDLTLMKTDNGIITQWAAPDGERLAKDYELAWNIPTKDLIDMYAIFQKFTDQGISADTFRRVQGTEKIGTKEMITDYLYMTKMGFKSRYYQNSLTAKGTNLVTGEEMFEEKIGAAGCGDDGVCAL